jgi:hypothetical protein
VSSSLTRAWGTLITRRFGRYLPSKNLVQITRVCPCLIPLEHPSSTCVIASCRTRKEASHSRDGPWLTIYRRCSNIPIRLFRGFLCTSSVNSSWPLLNSLHTLQRRLALIRIFVFLSAAAAAISIACSFLRTIIHFMLKVRILYSGAVNFDPTDCYRIELSD